MDESLSLSVIVKPGTVTDNFEQFKESLRMELESKYSTIEVSEEHLKEAKDFRAKLNKAKDQLKATMRSAQAENDQPLVVPKQQAKELEQILLEYISTIDHQIKEIEEKQRKLKMDEATAILASVFSDASEEVCEIAVKCEWIKKPEWGNKTYSAGRIAKDSREAREEIEHALELFQGEFRAQMLADYIKYGNLAKSQLFGAQLQRQKEAYEEAQRKRREASEQQVASIPVQEEERAPGPASSVSVPAEQSSYPEAETETDSTMLVKAPGAFVHEEKDYEQCFIRMKFSARRYQIAWLLDLLKEVGIQYQRITA